MQRFIICLMLCLSIASGWAQYKPTEANLQSREQFQDDKFGIFIHWGVYAMMAHGEWVMQNERLNAEEYARAAAGFYPARFDARDWVRQIKAAGARYITITSRHHDGFSMFASDATDYDIMDATSFGRDILKELADACHAEGIHLHVYYSHLDWTRPDYPLGRTGLQSGRPTDQQDYAHYYEFMNRQITEILTNYGTIRCMWFDGWWDHDQDKTPFDWRMPEQYRMIHELLPQCLILNNHHQTPFEGEDLQGFEQDLPGENTHGLSGQAISRYPLETCMTMNESWGYEIRDNGYKSADELIRNLVKAAGKNCNLLLNIGPKADGTFPIQAQERLRAIGEWMQQNGQTIYGTRGGCVGPHPWGVTTQRDKTLYVHILNHQDKGLYLELPAAKVKSAKMYANGQAVKVQKAGEGIVLCLSEAPKGVDTIVELMLK